MTTYSPKKKSIRIICKAKYLDHTNPLFIETKLLKINQLYKMNCVQFIYKCFNSNIFNDFKSRLTMHNAIHNYNTRGNTHLRLPFERLNICQKSFFYTGIRLWNDIPTPIKDANSIHYFKK